MAIQENPYPLRIDNTIMKKLKVISKDNGRSVNKEIEFVLKKYVQDIEAEKGTIKISDD